MNPTRPGAVVYRWRWIIAFAALAVTALALPWFGASGSQVVVYPTTDFARLPVRATALTPATPESCVSIQRVDATPKLVDEACGSSASTFRVIGRVANASQCVRDADLTYSSSVGPMPGAVCLDYDWAPDQCLHIADDAVAKVNCADRGAVRPEVAIVGAVDVSYCRDGGIAHPVRHFTVCTLAGDKNCKGRPRGT